MAIVERPTKKGIVYWVVTRGHGERVGFNRRAAERLDAQRKKEVKAGTYRPAVTAAATVGSYLQTWLDGRTNRSAELERTMLRIHVIEGCEWLASMRLEDVRPPHAKKFIQELKAKISAKTGKPLKPKYVANVNGAMKAAFNAAILDELLDRDVWRLPPGTISKKTEPKIPYSREDAAKLLASAERGRRIWLMLAFYTGMRAGEVCGRRWRDWDRASKPLGCLTIGTQYDDKPLKTDNPRKAPVHPELARALTEWWETGFEVVYLRKPRLDDFIIPSFPKLTRSLTRSAAYKAIVADCARAQVTGRGQHATRHTFISAAQRGGADPKLVERITHNASGSMIDHYTHREWDELCAAMLCLTPYGGDGGGGSALVAPLYSENAAAENMLESGSSSRTRTKSKRAESAESGESVDSGSSEEPPLSRGGGDLDAILGAGKESEEQDTLIAIAESADRGRATELARSLRKTTAPYLARDRALRRAVSSARSAGKLGRSER